MNPVIMWILIVLAWWFVGFVMCAIAEVIGERKITGFSLISWVSGPIIFIGFIIISAFKKLLDTTLIDFRRNKDG